MSDIEPGSEQRKRKREQQRSQRDQRSKGAKPARRPADRARDGGDDRESMTEGRAKRTERSSFERPSTPSEQRAKDRQARQEPGDRSDTSPTPGRSDRNRTTPRREKSDLRKRAEAIVDAKRGLGVHVRPGAVRRTMDRLRREARDKQTAERSARQSDQEVVDRIGRVRDRLPAMDNTTLQREAGRLHNAFQGREVPEAQRNALAPTLQAMRDEMARRIDRAPRNADGLPLVDGVRWSKDRPPGTVESVPPFDQSHVWERHLVDRAADRKPPERPSSRDQTPMGVTKESDDRYRIGGFGTGSVRLEVGAAKRFIDNVSEEQRECLGSENCVVEIRGKASMIGSDKANDPISLERAEQFREDLRAAGVKAKIIIRGDGSRDARAAGKAENDNSASDRRIDVTIRAGADTVRFDRGEVIEVKRRSIPREFQHGYKHSRGTVRSAWWKALQVATMVVPTPGRPDKLMREAAKKGPIEGLRQGVDGARWGRELSKAKSADEKLWAIAPPRGLIFDSQKPSFRRLVKSWLRDGGYDADAIYPEYVTHWHRKGVV